MTSTSGPISTTPVLLVVGAGPGLGLSVAHRFGASGFRVALVSRSDTRHAEYLSSLGEAGIDAATFVADASDTHSLHATIDAVRKRYGRIDVGYFGPASAGDLATSDITALDRDGADVALRGVLPAVDFASALIPELVERGSGGLLFAGGISSIVPIPPLGGLTLYSAALRNYAVTLHAALAPMGVYAGTLTVGGLIDRGDIHSAMLAGTDVSDAAITTLDPNYLANELWRLYTEKTSPEAVIH